MSYMHHLRPQNQLKRLQEEKKVNKIQHPFDKS